MKSWRIPATNSNQWPRIRITPRKVVGGAGNEVLNNLVTHVAQLTKQQGTVNAIQTNPWVMRILWRTAQ